MSNSGNNGAAPGGGGGGGGGTGSVGGNGGAGQVKLTYGASTTPPANVLRFVLDVPATGAVNGAILGQMLTAGTVAKVNVVYGTGGTLTMTGFNSVPAQLFTVTSGNIANGAPMCVQASLSQSGSAVAWSFDYITPGGSATNISSGSVATSSMGGVNTVNMNVSGTETGATVAGHVAVLYTTSAPLSGISSPLNAWAGERAATRFTRICTEEGIGSELTGNVADTPLMGNQLDENLIAVLQEVEDLDRGLLSETRDQFGLGYRTRVSMQNQAAVATLDYSAATLAGSMAPTYDDQLIRNIITLTRRGGATLTTQLSTGAMSVLAPPAGSGPYAYALTVNANADTQLANEAAWLLTLGTVNAEREPVVMVDMARPEVAALFASIPGLQFGDYFAVSNPPSFLTATAIKQLMYGYTETLGPFGIWTFTFNCVPETPYEGAGLPTW